MVKTETITAAEFKKQRKLNTNNETAAIVSYLTLQGHQVTRTNNHATFDITRAAGAVMTMCRQVLGTRRLPNIASCIIQLRKCYNKGTAQKGRVLDITGFAKGTGRYIGIEVKIGKDKPSPQQLETVQLINKNNGIGLVAKSFDNFKEQWEALQPVKIARYND